jgi:hypothetical protein
MSYLLWTNKSTRTLADELERHGYSVSHVTVARCLQELGYSLQANVKTIEGTQHPDRDAQFRYLNEQIRRFVRTHDPVVSVDTNYDPSRIMDIARGPIRVHAVVIEHQPHALIPSVYT